MLAVFVVWTILFILLSEPVVRFVFGFEPAKPGDTFYVEAWGPWIAITLVWLAPVVAGLVLAFHGLLLLVFTVPNIIERLLTL